MAMSVLLSPMPPLECSCKANRFERVHLYEAAPAGEVRFPFSGGAYRRTIERCGECTHYVTRHGMDTSGLYSGAYVDATYGDLQGVRKSFERIASLPEGKSDNAARVKRIIEYARPFIAKLGRAPRILDVGSGLCVFLDRMKKAGWDCTALDPDARACEHARTTVGVKAIHADFVKDDGFGRFDIIAFNKVLEHVPEPVAMLRKAARYLEPGGFVYVELPDAAAAGEGFGREEFFIEHLHIFTTASVALLVERAGYRLAGLQQVREPSSKYTLRGFAHPH
jgi:2-polyprenyl-3-methyl-5-hydroxy-6-metoxy-1,4-benzoquinol methylase